MGNLASRSRSDASRRQWLSAIDAARYMLLVILAISTIAGMRPAGITWFVDVGLCALAAAWMLWVFTSHPAWRERPRVMTPFFVVLVVIMAVLVVRDPWFGFMAPIGYSYAIEALPWPGRLAGVAAVAVVAATAQTATLHRTTPSGFAIYIAVLAANILPMCGLTWVLWNSHRLHDRSERALEEISEANRRLEATLAENAGLHEQLLTQAREAGVLDERQRMAREIHDTLAQGLTGIITQLQAAEQASGDPQEWRRRFAAAIGLARESLTEARRSMEALRPEPLQTARLGGALVNVAERWSGLHGVPVQVSTVGTARPMRPQTELTMLRTAQEALANVARHAQAAKVWLTLSYAWDEVSLDVRDDGRGFEPPSPGGFGLIAMRQRVEGLDGTLRVESEPGAGTTISARIPWASAEALT